MLITSIPVTGMSCANCARLIERKVGALAGVGSAGVDLVSEQLTVSFDPAVVAERDIIALVRRICYGVAL